MTEPSDATTRTAFLALDYAAYIVDNFSHDPAVVEGAAKALATARDAGLPVIHVCHEMMLGQLHPALGPVGDEPLIGKSNMGAFAGTDLQERLQAAGVGRLVIGGVATSGTVLSTTRWAVDVGYQVAVCADACADPDAQVHAALLDDSVFPTSWLGLWRIARVLTSAEITDFASPNPR